MRYIFPLRQLVHTSYCGDSIMLPPLKSWKKLWKIHFCKVVEIFIDQDPNYRSYNICAEKSISLMELAEMIRSINGGNTKIIVKNEGLNPVKTTSPPASPLPR